MPGLTDEQHREVVATIERILGDSKLIQAQVRTQQDLLADVMHAEAARLRGPSHAPKEGEGERVHAAAQDLVNAITTTVEAKANRVGTIAMRMADEARRMASMATSLVDERTAAARVMGAVTDEQHPEVKVHVHIIGETTLLSERDLQMIAERAARRTADEVRRASHPEVGGPDSPVKGHP